MYIINSTQTWTNARNQLHWVSFVDLLSQGHGYSFIASVTSIISDCSICGLFICYCLALWTWDCCIKRLTTAWTLQLKVSHDFLSTNRLCYSNWDCYLVGNFLILSCWTWRNVFGYDCDPGKSSELHCKWKQKWRYVQMHLQSRIVGKDSVQISNKYRQYFGKLFSKWTAILM